MATIFPDLDEFFSGTLTLPVSGKKYVIQSPSHKVGLYVQRLIEAGAAVASGRIPDDTAPKIELDDGEEVDLYATILGSAYEQLKSDDVPWPKIQFVANTALIWIGMGEPAAMAYWISGGDPKASPLAAPNRAARRAAESRPMAEANTTHSPESMNGTRPPSGSSRRRRNRR